SEEGGGVEGPGHETRGGNGLEAFGGRIEALHAVEDPSTGVQATEDQHGPVRQQRGRVPGARVAELSRENGRGSGPRLAQGAGGHRAGRPRPPRSSQRPSGSNVALWPAANPDDGASPWGPALAGARTKTSRRTSRSASIVRVRMVGLVMDW